MRSRLGLRTYLIIGAVALAGGLGAAVLVGVSLVGVDEIAAELWLLSWVALGFASILFTIGVAVRSNAASWRCEQVVAFKALYALNFFAGMGIAAAVIASLWSLAAGADRAALVSLLVAAGLLGAIWLANRWVERLRTRAMAELARGLYLGFEARGTLSLLDFLTNTGAFGPAAGGRVVNLMRGSHHGRELFAFDYLPCQSRDGGATPESTRVGRVSTLRSGMSVAMSAFPGVGFPGCVVVPRGMLPILTGDARFPGVELESHEFNGSHCVWSPNRKFAYDLVHSKMMEFLLARPDWAFEVAGGYVMVYTGRRWAMSEFPAAIEVLTGFVELIPRFLWKEQGEQSEAGRGS